MAVAHFGKFGRNAAPSDSHSAHDAARHGLRDLIGKWRRNIDTRHQLSVMSDSMLDDIGLTREAAEAEARKPFWRD
ncbi:DUF1127 domain-containing protein [Hahella sp. KA22]|uniref:DUF1127 domain-containing protein n=1 Tax=Hahella sp. KA22 TaxID=1628392 RepID=UPI000FDEC28A|nr:DUF1127 domain-containing protein [Hahella sp. KA22]AZZ89811.1 DUF1127 domain-containing protein [Hahella sp. KA22]QAY53181.1 DUF1127 domain-containing protein [Hahella sp. KA22]